MNNFFNELNSLQKFKKSNEQIKVIERKKPISAESFFRKLNKLPFSIYGNVSQENTNADIKELLKEVIPEKIQYDPFYGYWLEDMSEVCKLFCSFKGEDNISFWLGSKRGCTRYHVDMVPYRLLVTYDGQGTEILPDEAANRNAFINGKSNEEIVKYNSAHWFIDQWDVAIFRGGEKGILHRTPDSASNESSSVLMRLDGSSFFKEIEEVNKVILSN